MSLGYVIAKIYPIEELFQLRCSTDEKMVLWTSIQNTKSVAVETIYWIYIYNFGVGFGAANLLGHNSTDACLIRKLDYSEACKVLDVSRSSFSSIGDTSSALLICVYYRLSPLRCGFISSLAIRERVYLVGGFLVHTVRAPAVVGPLMDERGEQFLWVRPRLPHRRRHRPPSSVRVTGGRRCYPSNNFDGSAV